MSRLELLEDLYQNAHEAVWITDFSLNLLWKNQISPPAGVCDCRMLFGAAAAGELCSGVYFTRAAGDVYRFRVLRVPDAETPGTGYYVISFEDVDAIQSVLRCREVREYIENYTGEIRQSVTGVAMATGMLHNLLAEQGEKPEENAWLNIIMGHCYRLLKGATSISDTVQSAAPAEAGELIDYTQLIQTFSSVCSELCAQAASVTCNAAPELYVFAPPDRLLNCLLCLLLAARGENDDWNSFALTAYPEDGSAVLELTASAGGGVRDDVPLTRACPLHTASVGSTDTYLIRRFCEAYGGSITMRETNVFRCYTLRLPLSDFSAGTVCCSKFEQYAADRFSRYHIALSGIISQKFYQN